MHEAQGDQDANGEWKKALEVMYNQVAVQHDKIDDFRAKLLAALPVITGIGLLALGDKKPDGLNLDFLAAIGIFGALASIGLLVHELRGITECYMLISIGAALEHKLTNGDDDDARYGTFSSRLWWGFNRPVSRETAALIIYPATIAAWAFLAAWPMRRLWLSLLVALVVCIETALIAGICLAWERRRWSSPGGRDRSSA